MNIDPAVGVFLDGLIAVLLLAMIATGLFLNRRIERLRKSTASINGLVGGFDKATARARAGVEALRSTLRETGEQLQGQINVARGLRDDLRSMAVAGGRGSTAMLDEAVRASALSTKPSALGGGMRPKPKNLPKAEPRGMPPDDSAGAEPRELERVMAQVRAERPVTRKAAAAMAAAATADASEVERELRALLRNVR